MKGRCGMTGKIVFIYSASLLNVVLGSALSWIVNQTSAFGWRSCAISTPIFILLWHSTDEPEARYPTGPSLYYMSDGRHARPNSDSRTSSLTHPDD